MDALIAYAKKGWAIARLDPAAIDAVAADPEATKYGLIILFLKGVACSLGSVLSGASLISLLSLGIYFCVFFLVMVGIFYLLAVYVFKGKGEYWSLFRPIACGDVIGWVGVVPAIGPVLVFFILPIWEIVIAVTCVERTMKVTRGEAVLTVLIPVILALILVGITLFLGFVSFLALMTAFGGD